MALRIFCKYRKLNLIRIKINENFYLKRNLTQANENEFSIKLTNGRLIRLSSGKLAKLADGSTVASTGNTNVLVTVVSKDKLSSAGFIPLTVDYRQKSAAAGRIPLNHLRRDLGQNEKEILTSRMIDRSLRPLFPVGYFNETQIVCNLLSLDGINDPDVLSLNAASAALTLSDIPWNGPIGAVKLALVDNEIIVNPTRKELQESKFNLIVTATEQKSVVMLEGWGNEVISLNDVLKMIKKGIKETQLIIKGINEMAKFSSKVKRSDVRFFAPTKQHVEAAQMLAETRLREVLTNFNHDKFSRDAEIQLIRQDVLQKLRESFTDEETSILADAFYQVMKNVYRELIFDTEQRCDGRSLTQLRNIKCEVDLFPSLHGSSMFQRGQTQVICSTTFDSPDAAFKYDQISSLIHEVKEKNFMLHYEFPSYATNETGKIGGPMSRREVGHGNLAEKSLRPVVPKNFPFTIRLGCEVLESNGSSSMASVCAGSLSLLDSGVDISAPAAGVAMGLFTRTADENIDEDNKETKKSDEDDDQEREMNENEISNKKEIKEYKILTDILGLEDYLGEMDFKIAGTKKGFTALQLDVKLKTGLTMKMITDILQQSVDGKNKILANMSSTINKPNESKKFSWPQLKKLDIPANKRAKFLGFGGSNLKRLTSEIGVRFSPDAEDVNSFVMFAPNGDALMEANEQIESLLQDDEYKEQQLDFGAIYTARIVEIRDNGVMIELYPKMRPTLLHLKELDQRKVAHPSALNLEVGQEIQVKYFGRDPVSGVMRVSRRVLQMTESKSRSLL